MEYFINMKNFIIYLNLAVLVCTFCGCSKPHRKPPTERLALTVRFFDSIAAKDSATAVRQGQKLYDMDNSQDYILRLIGIQESNEAIYKAQQLVRKGKITAAITVIEAAKKQYPQNQTLNAALIQIKGLKDAEKVFARMRNAGNASAMSGALTAAKDRLFRNRTPALEKYFQRYEQQLALTKKREERAVSQAEKRADADAKRASADDQKRQAAEQKFKQDTTQKTAEGEKLRQDAGDIPFEDRESTAK